MMAGKTQKMDRKEKSGKILAKVIPIIGSLILFSSWVFQRTYLDEANSALQKIYNAESVFQAYQSNNAMFNAVIEMVDDEAVAERIRRLQIRNYEYGLRDMEALIDDEIRAGIPEPFDALGGSSDIETGISITQERLKSIQGELASQKESITQQKSELNKIFLSLYVVGTLTVLSGGILNALIAVQKDEEKSKSK
jgi:hypothetical protein